MAAWLINETFALEQLWQLNSDGPTPAEVCGGVSPESSLKDLRCFEGTAQVWDTVISLNRPVVLDMQTPGRFSAATLVVVFEGSSAWVLGDAGLERIKLVDMAVAWRGGYRLLWQPPQGWRRPLVEGDIDPVVAAVAQLFAEFDQQNRPLTEQRFNTALVERVRLFQAQNGLTADGVVGAQTLMKLNDVLGKGVTPTWRCAVPSGWLRGADMSMILDALKRAKEEGDSPVEVPSIDSTQELTVKEPPATSALKYLAFGIGLGVLITAGVLVTRNEPPAPDSAVAPQNEKVILPKSVSPPAKALPRALEPARPVTTGNDRTQGSAQNRTQVAELYRVAEDTPLSIVLHRL